MDNRRLIYRPLVGLLFLFGLGIACLVATNAYVAYKAKPFLYASPSPLPYRRVALVLGTSERLSTGGENLFFAYRMQAAAKLFKEKHCSILLVSGDNRTPFYNEPQMMRNALIALGVPASAIWTDYGGTRTLQSVLRCHQVFGQERFIIVSQRFHAERAVYLARASGLDAIGYCAQDVESSAGLITHMREYAAKLIALWDLAGMRRG